MAKTLKVPRCTQEQAIQLSRLGYQKKPEYLNTLQAASVIEQLAGQKQDDLRLQEFLSLPVPRKSES